MTTLHWEQAEITRDFSRCETLHDMILQVEKVSYQKGEVICEIRVNGVLLSENDESKFAAHDRATIKTLAISTQRTDQLIREALVSTADFIPDLESSCVNAAEALRGAVHADGQRAFGETLQGCHWLIETLSYIRGAASGIQLPIERSERWIEAEQAIIRSVREMNAAYNNNDSILVADLLEYEVTAALSIWREVLGLEQKRRISA